MVQGSGLCCVLSDLGMDNTTIDTIFNIYGET